MLKVSNYMIISAFFIFIFFVFIILNPEVYNVKSVSDMDSIITQNSNSLLLEQGELNQNKEDYEIAIITDELLQTNIEKNIVRTLSLLRQNFIICRDINEAQPAKTLIIAKQIIDYKEVMELKTFLENGGSVIFIHLPQLITEELMEVLGITQYVPNYEIVGYDIYDGILLGGMFRAEELSLYCSKVSLSGGCKVFANGHNKDRDIKAVVIDREDENPLIWRNYYEGGMIFVINAPFIEDVSGIGILTGILAQSTNDFIYPIIGTKNIVLDEFPYITDDNTYINNRTSYGFTRDIIWPDLVSMSRNFDLVFSCYTNGDFDKNKDSYNILRFLNNELYKTMNGEIGYSLGSSLENDIIAKDFDFINERFINNPLRSLKLDENNSSTIIDYGNNFTSILTWDWFNAFNWVTDKAVSLPILTSGVGEESTDLMMTSMVSTLGLIMHTINFEPVYNSTIPWNEFSIDVSKYLWASSKKYNFLKATSVKDTSELVKDYLNLNLQVEKSEQSIRVFIYDNVGEVSFFLRTNKEIDIDKSTNCKVIKIEEGIYMIKSMGTEFVIWYNL